MCGCVALGILFLFKQVDVAEWQPGLLLCHINLLFFGWLTVFYSIQHCRPRSVIPSLRSRASSERSEGSLTEQRSFAALRMTKRDGLFFRNVLGLVLDILAPGSGIRGGLHHGRAVPQMRFFSRIRA